MITIESTLLRVEIDPVGAEYASITRKDTGLQYLWTGDPAWWARRSPVLFPFVGVSHGGSYTYGGQRYEMTPHGYASKKTFTVKEAAEDRVTFVHASDEVTRAVYPFEYELQVTYTVSGDTLACDFAVVNRTDGEMVFSLGGHPGFRVPLLEGETWADYRIRFGEKETAATWCFRNGGIQWTTEPCLVDTDTLELEPHMFDEDARILKGLKSRTVSLEGKANGHAVTMDMHRFPVIAIWSAGPNAPFVCLEPWFGHADMAGHDGELTHKPDVLRLLKGETFTTGYTLTFR